MEKVEFRCNRAIGLLAGTTPMYWHENVVYAAAAAIQCRVGSPNWNATGLIQTIARLRFSYPIGFWNS